MPNQLTGFDPIHLTYLTSLNPTPLTQSRTIGHCLDSILPDCHSPVWQSSLSHDSPQKIALNYGINGVNPWKQQRSENVNHVQIIIIQHFTKKKNKKQTWTSPNPIFFNLLLLYFGGRELWNCISSPSLETPSRTGFQANHPPSRPHRLLDGSPPGPEKNLMLSMSIKKDINGRNIARVSYIYLPPTLTNCQMCANKLVLFQ